MDLLNLTKIAAMTETECRCAFEDYRWPNGVRCPRCDEMAAIAPMGGKRAGKGWYRCNTCNREGRLSQFTVKVGTVMEDSPIRFKVWLMAWCMEVSSKKGYSSHQMARNLGVTQKTAWFIGHRIRHAMEISPDAPMLGGPGKIVEVDETYVGGRRRGSKGGRPSANDPQKTPVVALVERNGRVRATPTARVTSKSLKGAIRENVDPRSRVMTDEFPSYRGLEKEFTTHEVVEHRSGEYVRGEAHTNTVEGFFGLLKRGVNGTFHHVSKGHLHRYCDEFAFRWSYRNVSDGARLVQAIAQADGKRLLYRQPSAAGVVAGLV